MCKGLHVKHPLVLLYFKLEFAEEIVEKFSNITIHENPDLSYMKDCNSNELCLVFVYY